MLNNKFESVIEKTNKEKPPTTTKQKQCRRLEHVMQPGTKPNEYTETTLSMLYIHFPNKQ